MWRWNIFVRKKVASKNVPHSLCTNERDEGCNHDDDLLINIYVIDDTLEEEFCNTYKSANYY